MIIIITSFMNIRFDFYLQCYNIDKVALLFTDKM